MNAQQAEGRDQNADQSQVGMAIQAPLLAFSRHRPCDATLARPVRRAQREGAEKPRWDAMNRVPTFARLFSSPWQADIPE